MGDVSPEGRIRRAFDAGQLAGLVLQGQRATVPPTPRLALRNTCYVVLRAGSWPPFWARRWGVVREVVGTGDLGDSVLHGWPSHAEAEAYALGSGLPGLPVERQ